MLKKILVVCIALALIISLSACNQPQTQTKIKEKVKIGVLAPLTGDASAWGLATQKGIELAFDELTEEGKDFELIFEDSRCDPKVGLTAAQKLISQDKVKVIIGTTCSSVTLTIAPTLENNHTILLSVGSSAPEITQAGDYIFRLWPSDTYEGTVLSSFAFKDLNLKKLAVIYINNNYGQGLLNVFSESFNNQGGQIATSQPFELNAKDFRSQLSKIKSLDHGGIYIVGNPSEVPLILNQINELNMTNKPILTNLAAESDELLEVAPTASEGIMFASYGWKNPDRFLDDYRFKYNEGPKVTSDTGYDSLKLISKAIDECGKVDSTCIKDELYKIKDYMGAAGKTTFDENGDVIDKEFVIKTVENGEFVEYKNQ